MKLQKGIVLGEGRKLALAMCLVALTTGAAHATTYYSGNGSANGTLDQAVKWYTDANYTTAADPQPTPTANDDNTYVFIGGRKISGSVTFPEGTHVWFGTPTTRWYPNCQSINWTLPDCTIYGLRYLPNWSNSGQFLRP